MGMYAPVKEGGSAFEIPPEDSLIGAVAKLEYVGVHRGSGKASEKQSDTLVVWFEFEQRDSKGARFDLPWKVTMSLHEKAWLRKLVNIHTPGISNEDARRFDLESLIGLPVLVTVEHWVGGDGEKRASVRGVGKLPSFAAMSIGPDGWVFEGNWEEETRFARFLRGEHPEKRPATLVTYDPDKFSKPRPIHEKRVQDEGQA